MSETDMDPDLEGIKWGCLSAALLGIPMFAFLLLVDALGDCAPEVACRKGFLQYVLLPSAVIAAIVGLTSYWLAKRRYSKRQ